MCVCVSILPESKHSADSGIPADGVSNSSDTVTQVSQAPVLVIGDSSSSLRVDAVPPTASAGSSSSIESPLLSSLSSTAATDSKLSSVVNASSQPSSTGSHNTAKVVKPRVQSEIPFQ